MLYDKLVAVMRDLAGQNYSQSKIAIPQSIIRIIILLIVAVAILFLAKAFVNSGGIGGSSIVLHDAPKGLTPVTAPGVSDIAQGAVNLVVENASFTDVSGEGGSATATRKYGDGSFVLTVNATLPAPPQGHKYQVWLVREILGD